MRPGADIAPMEPKTTLALNEQWPKNILATCNRLTLQSENISEARQVAHH